MEEEQSFSKSDLVKLKEICRLLSSDVALKDGEGTNMKKLDEMLKIYHTASVRMAAYQEVQGGSTGPLYGFNKVVARFLHLLRECVVTHNWPKALQLVQALVSERDRAGATIWKVGLAGLYQDGERNATLVDKFVRNLCVLKQVSSLEVLLDYLFFLLVQGNVAEAKELVVDWKREKRERFNMHTNEKRKMASTLFFAYQGLILYTEWKVATRAAQEEEEEDIDLFGLVRSQDVTSRTTKFLADEAIEYLKFVQDTPGVWDLFVTRLAEIYEYYEMEECRTLLRSFRDKNLANPNGHRYLYEYEVRNGGDKSVQIECLQALIQLDPSNSLALKLFEELAASDRKEEGLLVLFDFLDFPSGEENELAWKMLAKTLAGVQDNESLCEILSEQWRLRKDWWPRAKFGDTTTMAKYKRKVKGLLYSLDT